MPSWTKKEERTYEHIKDSSKKRGASTKRAKQVAARTVNKNRRKAGETPNKTTTGKGNPNKGLEDRSVQELKNMASDMKIEGRSKMRKSELVSAIRKHR